MKTIITIFFLLCLSYVKSDPITTEVEDFKYFSSGQKEVFKGPFTVLEIDSDNLLITGHCLVKGTSGNVAPRFNEEFVSICIEETHFSENGRIDSTKSRSYARLHGAKIDSENTYTFEWWSYPNDESIAPNYSVKVMIVEEDTFINEIRLYKWDKQGLLVAQKIFYNYFDEVNVITYRYKNGKKPGGKIQEYSQSQDTFNYDKLDENIKKETEIFRNFMDNYIDE
ncbi:MAG: hypothetical protein ACE364_07865 [Chlorobiota bacterium]